ncbi:hypothetical protein VitviT2T_024717 [Vitis vinifera]|uniref:Uncharacterized protein n=1 Tax=Vitis vinifera TaxID=29760 RepID=A0ABY9DHG7_VITVI|nr:hypothetical protein VitviT2T_024717 [Vitis vinifera]
MWTVLMPSLFKVILSHLHFSTRFLGHCHPSRSCSLYTSFQILQGYPINFHGFLGVIPAVHAVIIHRDHPQIFAALGFEMMVAVRYAAGAGFYVSKFPEQWKPGAFDIARQSFH